MQGGASLRHKEHSNVCVSKLINMQAAWSSAAYWKGFDNEKGDCVTCNAGSPCALVSSSAFQTEREKVCTAPLLDRKLVCSTVASWLPQGWLWDNFWVLTKCFSPPEHFDSHRVGLACPASSSDQWLLMEERSRTERFCAFFLNQFWQFNFYDPSKCHPKNMLGKYFSL